MGGINSVKANIGERDLRLMLRVLATCKIPPVENENNGNELLFRRESTTSGGLFQNMGHPSCFAWNKTLSTRLLPKRT
jgi:hypothetical protein